MPPHHRGKSLGPGGAVSAPKGSLRASSAFFAGLLQPFVLYQEGLGVVAANIKSLACVRKIHHLEGSVSAFSDASVFRILFFGSWRSAKFSSSWLLAWVSPRLRWSSRGSWLRFGVFSTVLDSASALSARLANSGVLPRVDFLSLRMFSGCAFSRKSRQLGEVSACGASVVISSSESYWTLSVSGLLQPGNESTSFSQLAPCFYHEWIYPFFLASVDEDAVLFDSAHSGVTAVAAVVPVALHRPWVHLDSEALVRWSSEIREDLFWWWAHEQLELVNSLGRVSPQLICGPALQMSVDLSSQPFSGFRVDPEHFRVSAASVKVVGVTRPVCNHTFSPLLALFFSFPRSQRF